MAVKIDPELVRQIAIAGDGAVQAVCELRAAHQPHAIPSPAEFSALAEAVMDRVASKVGRRAMRTNILRNLASVIVQADAEFVRTLLTQPEVISALPNQTSESLFIAPVRGH